MSVFGQVWLWSLAAFVLGVVLTWLLLVRPARARVRELERRVVAHRWEPVNSQQPVSAEAGASTQRGQEPEAAVAASDAALPERPSHGLEAANHETNAGTEDVTDHQATEPADTASAERTEYLPAADGRTRVDLGSEVDAAPQPAAESDIGAVLNRDDAAPQEARPAESGPTARGLFQPALPSTTPQYETEAASSEPGPAQEPSETNVQEQGTDGLLPKRQRREAPRGGFDPPEPIQPSMRAVTRREPTQHGRHSGSLFEPSMPVDGESELPQESPPEPAESERDAPVGPFGTGSAMPLPGGGKPSESFTIKASVTTLRYCAPNSERFEEMVAEVWFRTAQDAERVGFRPIG